jgi:hypothetical protein
MGATFRTKWICTPRVDYIISNTQASNANGIHQEGQGTEEEPVADKSSGQSVH